MADELVHDAEVGLEGANSAPGQADDSGYAAHVSFLEPPLSVAGACRYGRIDKDVAGATPRIMNAITSCVPFLTVADRIHP